VPWVNKQLASSDLIFRRREKADGVKYSKNGAGRTSWRHFPQPFIENRGGDGILGTGMAKNKFCTDMLGLLRPKPLQIFAKALWRLAAVKVSPLGT
jgi:hypothetical protein